MKITYKGKATVTQMVADEIEGETPTDLTGSTCNIMLTITGERATTKPPMPSKKEKPPKPAKKSPKKK